MNDLISRAEAIELKPEFLNPNVNRETKEQTAIDRAYARGWNSCNTHWIDEISKLPSAQPEIIRCKDCKHFELDHFEKVEGFPVPIIVAHEICMKWSDGCRTSKDGWCFMGERRTDGSD